MSPTFLLLFAVWLHEGLAICFRNESSRVKRVKVGRPAAVDEYHCKIMCVEMNECLAYLFTDYECFLLGTTYTDSSTCILPYYEWVKKTVDVDCPISDYFAQPPIEAGYVSNPAIAAAVPAPTGFNTSSHQTCPSMSFADFTLADNSNLVNGNCESTVTWDGALGSWAAVMKRGQIVEMRPKTVTVYIRGARCFMTNCAQFSDTASCGGSIPIMPEVGAPYQIMRPIQAYGKRGVCPDNEFVGYFSDFWSKVNSYSSNLFCVECIDGQYIFSTASSVYAISHAACMKIA